MKRGTMFTLLVLGVFIAASGGVALAQASLEEQRMIAETPLDGSAEFQEMIETGSLPSERAPSYWESSPREIGVIEDGYWAFEESGVYPPEFAGMTETGSLPKEQFEVVELNGIEHRMGVEFGGGGE